MLAGAPFMASIFNFMVGIYAFLFGGLAWFWPGFVLQALAIALTQWEPRFADIVRARVVGGSIAPASVRRVWNAMPFSPLPVRRDVRWIRF